MQRGRAFAVSIPYSSSIESGILSRLRPRVGRFSAELLCVLRSQSLPAAELHCLRACDAADGGSAKEAIQHVQSNVPARGAPRDEATVDLMPQGQARAAVGSCEFPPDVVVFEQCGLFGSRYCCFDPLARSHPREIHRVSSRTELPIGYKGSPLEQMRRVG